MDSTDSSAAAIRTSLAWQRTSLALGVLAAISIKLTLVDYQLIGVVASVAALFSAAVLYVFGRIRFSSQQGPLFLLLLSSLSIILLSIVATIQII